MVCSRKRSEVHSEQKIGFLRLVGNCWRICDFYISIRFGKRELECECVQVRVCVCVCVREREREYVKVKRKRKRQRESEYVQESLFSMELLLYPFGFFYCTKAERLYVNGVNTREKKTRLDLLSVSRNAPS